jgi:hypothetical protein
MGDTIWVQVEEGRTIKGGDRDNSIMLRLEKNLGAVARKLKVRKLTDFYDYSSLEAEYSDSPGKPLWSEATEGLASVEAIHDHLQSHPEDLGFTPDRSREHWPKDLMVELQYCFTTLKAAASAKRKFRFLVVS